MKRRQQINPRQTITDPKGMVRIKKGRGRMRGRRPKIKEEVRKNDTESVSSQRLAVNVEVR